VRQPRRSAHDHDQIALPDMAQACILGEPRPAGEAFDASPAVEITA
jgi:hypothetical protein